MKIHLPCILFLSIVWISCDTEKSDISVDDKVFFKFYGGEYVDEGLDVVQTQDNGYLIVGSTTSANSGENRDILLVKTDINGNAQWLKTIGDVGDDIARKIKRLPDGGYIIIGDFTLVEENLHNREIFLLRLDASGNEVWRKTYGYSRDTVNFEDFGMDVSPNEQGNFLVVGHTKLNESDAEILFFVTNNDGEVIGDQTLIGQNNTIEHAKSVIPDPTGTYLAYIAGYTNHSENQGQDGFNMFLINVNKDGSIPFPNIIGGLRDEYADAMILTDDQGLLVLGSEVQGNSSRLLLRKLNLRLDVEWEVFPDIEGVNNLKGAGLCKTNDGYVVLAHRRITGIDSKMILYKVDFQGFMLWDTYISFGGEFNDKANSIIVDDQQHLVITGQMAFTALGSNAKMCLIKTRSDGQLKP